MVSAPDLVLNPKKTMIYRVCSTLVRVLAWLFFRPTVEGAENIPLNGPVLLAPIHRSNVDFSISLFVSPRKVFFMAKDGIFRSRLFGALLIRLGAFPVHRSSTDRESMRLAEEVLRRGHALVLFPEGTRKEGAVVEPLHDGAMFIAARSGAKVVPIGIAGSERVMPPGSKFPHFAKVHVVVGTPIDPPVSTGRVSRSEISAKTEELRNALEGVYAQSRRRQR